ncbi:MAG: NAD(P)-dependent oxidoreductase [Nitrospinae bacterium]|nr:NAD(P)-dependent oxidoreductase [Nitrospinota bacterium]
MARKATKKIAFLGLGRMGGLMTKHLVDAGFPVTGYDPSAKAITTAKKNGAKTARTVAAAVKGADVVCSSLPSPAVVRDVYLGPKGVLDTARRGAVCFELSTSTVSLAKEIAEAAKKKGIAFLDAPVSGSIPHLERKEVAAIVGGDQAALKEHRDVLDAFSKSITYMGKSGNGLIMKLVTNHILNIHHSGMAEGLAFGMKAGLTAPRMMKFLQGSVIPLLIHYKGTTMAARDYSDVIANLGISFKDLGLSINEANDLGAPVPLGAAARQQYTSAMALGLEDADFNAVFESFLNAMGTKPKRK